VSTKIHSSYILSKNTQIEKLKDADLIKTEQWSSRLDAGCKADDFALQKKLLL
jgi:predicted transglutaminase-like cysteine proteinase